MEAIVAADLKTDFRKMQIGSTTTTTTSIRAVGDNVDERVDDDNDDASNGASGRLSNRASTPADGDAPVEPQRRPWPLSSSSSSSTESLSGQTIMQPHLDEMEKRIMEKVDERLQDIQTRMNAKLDLILDHMSTQKRC